MTSALRIARDEWPALRWRRDGLHRLHGTSHGVSVTVQRHLRGMGWSTWGVTVDGLPGRGACAHSLRDALRWTRYGLS